MSERQILEMGIRAMGVTFIVRALSDAHSSVVPIAMGSGGSSLVAAFACTRVVFAIAVTWLAPQIASWIVEPAATPNNLPSAPSHTWNRWLIASAGALSVATLWLQSIVNTARTFIFTVGTSVGDRLGTNGFSGTLLVEGLIVLVVAYVVFRRPQWIVGRSTRGH